jgi:hypothetical protein
VFLGFISTTYADVATPAIFGELLRQYPEKL